MNRRSALVTGASAGIGAAVASALAADGWSLTLVGRDQARLDSVVAALTAAGHEAIGHRVDLSEPGAASGSVDAHVARFGSLDLVVANAGGGTGARVARVEPADLDAMLRLNVSGQFELARAALPHLRRPATPELAADSDRPPVGWFVVVASIIGTWPTVGFSGYAATKAAAISLARSIAIEEAAQGVRSCAICPGFVDTDMAAWRKEREPEMEILAPHDVAETVRFLLRLSPAASVTELVLRRASAAPSEA